MFFQHQSADGLQAREQFQQKLDNFVSKQYTFNKLKINDIASKLAMCERQLHRKVKAHLNMTPTEYLRKYRLNQASRLLKQGQSAKRVTYSVGFSSYSYFARCFKREFGCTTKEYARREQVKPSW